MLEYNDNYKNIQGANKDSFSQASLVGGWKNRLQIICERDKDNRRYLIVSKLNYGLNIEIMMDEKIKYLLIL